MVRSARIRTPEELDVREMREAYLAFRRMSTDHARKCALEWLIERLAADVEAAQRDEAGAQR